MLFKVVLVLVPLCLFSLMVAAIVGVMRSNRIYLWLFAIASATLLGGLICNLMTHMTPPPPNPTLLSLSLYLTLAGTISGTAGAWWFLGFGGEKQNAPESNESTPENP